MEHLIPQLVELGKFSSRFTAPIFFGKPDQGKPNNGTLTLFDSPNGVIGITCSHVVRDYEKFDHDGQAIFQIGDFVLNPRDYLIAENENLDLATFDLSQFPADISGNKRYPEIGGARAPYIYQSDIVVGDTVIFGGFPGVWAEYSEQNVTIFQTFSSTPAKVVSACPDHFSCQFDDLNSWPWYKEIQGRGKELDHPGGLSGGPVFVVKESDAGIMHFELAGIIYRGKFLNNSLIITARSAKLINSDGTIIDDFSSHLHPDNKTSAELNSAYDDQTI